MVEHAQHDSFRLVEIEQPPALENRECHEEDVSLVGKSSSPVAHADDCVQFRRDGSRGESAVGW
jgi:hypothetical protein